MKKQIERIKEFIGNGYMRQALSKQPGLKKEDIDWIVQKLLAELK